MNADRQRAIPEEMTAVDLRRQIRDVAQRVSRLAADRRLLEEARVDLAVEGDEIGQEIAAVDRERAELAAKQEQEQRRLEEIEADLHRLELEIPVLEGRCREQTARSEELARENEEVEVEVLGLRRDLSTSEQGLETLKESLSRIDRRLQREVEE
jgi:chromosome segregation ATPase